MHEINQISKFLSYLVIERNASPETVKAYKKDLKIFNDWLSGQNIEIITIDTNVIRAFLQFQNQKNLKAASIKRRIACLRSFFSYLEENEIIAKSPMKMIHKSFKVPKRLPKVLSIPEMEALLRVPDKEQVIIKTSPEMDQKTKERKIFACIRNRAIIELFFATGIRISELCNLEDRKSTRLNSSHIPLSRMPSSACIKLFSFFFLFLSV